MKNYPLEISLNSDKRLIHLVKKNGLETYNPQGQFNGYGYERLPLAASIHNEEEEQLFESLICGLKEKPKKASKTEDEIILCWSKRLSKLTGITIEKALGIAHEKLDYKKDQIHIVEERQFTERYSIKRQKLIDRMHRENPLRRIKDAEHAVAILAASHRHTGTNYEYLLEEGRDLIQWGMLDRGMVKSYARGRFNRN